MAAVELQLAADRAAAEAAAAPAHAKALAPRPCPGTYPMTSPSTVELAPVRDCVQKGRADGFMARSPSPRWCCGVGSRAPYCLG